MPTLEEYIKKQDWVGAIAWLENEKRFKNYLHFAEQLQGFQSRNPPLACLRLLSQWRLQVTLPPNEICLTPFKESYSDIRWDHQDQSWLQPGHPRVQGLLLLCTLPIRGRKAGVLERSWDAATNSTVIVCFILKGGRMFHIAQKKNDDKNLMTYHHKL